jgi:hypothetical protein
MPLTCANVLVDVLPGRVSGAVGLIAANVLVGGTWCFAHGGTTPTRFPTLLACVHREPPPFVNCSDAKAVAAGERCRTGVNETRTETRTGRGGLACGLVAAR